MKKDKEGGDEIALSSLVENEIIFPANVGLLPSLEHA